MKKVTKLFFFVFVFILALGGCSKEDKPKEKTITFMIPDWGVPTDKMLEEFQKEKGIKVNVETVSWDDIRNKVSVAATGKKAAADVMEVDWSWVGEFKSAGWLAPITLSEETVKDIPTLETFTVNNEILAVPYANDFRIAYYNKDIYNKAGLKAPITWEEVGNNMKSIKEQGILKYPYTLPLNATEGTTTALIWMTFMRDGKVFNENGSLNKENVMKSLNFINEMVKEGVINPANLNMKDIDTYREILSGEAAYMIGPTSFIARANDSNQSKVLGQIEAVLPPGENSTAKVTMALPEAIGVSAYSENKEDATEFVKWYTSPKIQEELYNKLSTMPTRMSVLNKLINSGEIANSGALLETAKRVKSPFPMGVPDYYSEMSRTISNSVNKMASGAISPEMAFEEMNNKINELIENK